MVDFHSLDNSLLFVLTLIGMIIFFVGVIGQNSWIIALENALPAIVPGVLLPFYVGHLRVGMTHPRSLLERTRGWELLFVGNFAILAILVSAVARDARESVYVVDSVEMLIVFVGISIAYVVTRKLVHVFAIQLTYRQRLALVASSAIGILLAAIAYFIDGVFEYASFEYLNFPIILYLQIVLIYLALFSSLLLVGIERACESPIQQSSKN